jgi:hypothetical protein
MTEPEARLLKATSGYAGLIWAIGTADTRLLGGSAEEADGVAGAGDSETVFAGWGEGIDLLSGTCEVTEAARSVPGEVAGFSMVAAIGAERGATGADCAMMSLSSAGPFAMTSGEGSNWPLAGAGVFVCCPATGCGLIGAAETAAFADTDFFGVAVGLDLTFVAAEAAGFTARVSALEGVLIPAGCATVAWAPVFDVLPEEPEKKK